MCEHFVVRCDFMAESSCRPRMVDGDGAAKRRRQRLRSWLRHEQQTVAAVLATVSHHSYPKVDTAHHGLRAVRTVTSTREGVEHEKYVGLRAQKPPLPGKRPGVLKDPELQGGAVTDGYVAAPAPPLAVPLLASAAGEAVDHSTLQFLLTHAIETKKALEEEERLKRVQEAVARLRAKVHAGEPLSAAEHEAWYGTSLFLHREEEEEEKEEKEKAPEGSSSSLWCSSWARSLCPCCATTGAWFDGAANCGCSAVAFHRRSSTFPYVPQKQILMVQSIRRIIEIPQLPLVFRWSMSLLCWSCRFSTAAVEKTAFLLLSAGPDDRHHGRYGSKGQLCRDTAVFGWFCGWRYSSRCVP